MIIRFIICTILLSGCTQRVNHVLSDSAASSNRPQEAISEVLSWNYQKTDLANNLELPLPDNHKIEVDYHSIKVTWDKTYNDKQSKHFEFLIGINDPDSEEMFNQNIMYVQEKKCNEPVSFKKIKELKNGNLTLTRMESTQCSKETQFRMNFYLPYFIIPSADSTNDQIDLIEQILLHARIRE